MLRVGQRYGADSSRARNRLRARGILPSASPPRRIPMGQYLGGCRGYWCCCAACRAACASWHGPCRRAGALTACDYDDGTAHAMCNDPCHAPDDPATPSYARVRGAPGKRLGRAPRSRFGRGSGGVSGAWHGSCDAWAVPSSHAVTAPAQHGPCHDAHEAARHAAQRARFVSCAICPDPTRVVCSWGSCASKGSFSGSMRILTTCDCV